MQVMTIKTVGVLIKSEDWNKACDRELDRLNDLIDKAIEDAINTIPKKLDGIELFVQCYDK